MTHGQWEVVRGWGVRNVFHGGAIELRSPNLSDEELSAFRERLVVLLNGGGHQPPDHRFAVIEARFHKFE